MELPEKYANDPSQGFWNNIELLDEKKIRRIQDEITKLVVEQYAIDLYCLFFDNTNFFIYLDTANPATLLSFAACVPPMSLLIMDFLFYAQCIGIAHKMCYYILR